MFDDVIMWNDFVERNGYPQKDYLVFNSGFYTFNEQESSNLCNFSESIGRELSNEV